MQAQGRHADYDPFAWFYDRHWGSFSRQVLPVLERLVLGELPAGARILDLCCGTGHLAALLTERGFRVVGVDVSPGMLAFARVHAPQADFVLADARDFALPGAVDAAVSLYDSLNHILALDELARVFVNVRRALVPGGRFVFDLNMDEGYRGRWRGSSGLVEDDHALIARPAYDAQQRLARMDLTLFRLVDGIWRREDVTLLQRAYTESEVREALLGAGFADVVALDAERDLRMPWGQGRTFFVATVLTTRRPSPMPAPTAGAG